MCCHRSSVTRRGSADDSPHHCRFPQNPLAIFYMIPLSPFWRFVPKNVFIKYLLEFSRMNGDAKSKVGVIDRCADQSGLLPASSFTS
ncbi:hypothetical protein CDAR_36321 [Caerostris darwini]|uniref:Uncharacterized protein n=1 Tax=Caerostris darwini TaxID=1538125 RepID=A0AAV4R8H7_9ARAC|nr:hypothetical protein CDAR_36321 [Caerostris darwini]